MEYYAQVLEITHPVARGGIIEINDVKHYDNDTAPPNRYQRYMDLIFRCLLQ